MDQLARSQTRSVIINTISHNLSHDCDLSCLFRAEKLLGSLQQPHTLTIDYCWKYPVYHLFTFQPYIRDHRDHKLQGVVVIMFGTDHTNESLAQVTTFPCSRADQYFMHVVMFVQRTEKQNNK